MASHRETCETSSIGAGLKPGGYMRHGKCHRDYTAGGAQHGGIAQGNLRDVFESLASFGKGEKVG